MVVLQAFIYTRDSGLIHGVTVMMWPSLLLIADLIGDEFRVMKTALNIK